MLVTVIRGDAALAEQYALVIFEKNQGKIVLALNHRELAQLQPFLEAFLPLVDVDLIRIQRFHAVAIRGDHLIPVLYAIKIGGIRRTDLLADLICLLITRRPDAQGQPAHLLVFWPAGRDILTR